MWLANLIKDIIIGIVNAYDPPKDTACPDCGGRFPEFYMTEKGTCQACNKKSQAYNSMGYPRIQHAKEREPK